MRHPIESLEPVLAREELIEIQERVKHVRIDEKVSRYVLAIVHATRNRDEVTCGASPRGSLVLSRMAQALALMEGRDHCLPDDVKLLAVPVLAHRLILPSSFRSNVKEQSDVVRRILDETEVP